MEESNEKFLLYTNEYKNKEIKLMLFDIIKQYTYKERKG